MIVKSSLTNLFVSSSAPWSRTYYMRPVSSVELGSTVKGSLLRTAALLPFDGLSTICLASSNGK